MKADTAFPLPDSLEVAKPKTFKELEVGQVVEVGGNASERTMLFQVEKLYPDHVLLACIEPVMKGRRWDFTPALRLRRFRARIGEQEYKMLAVNKDRIRLQPVGEK